MKFSRKRKIKRSNQDENHTTKIKIKTKYTIATSKKSPIMMSSAQYISVHIDYLNKPVSRVQNICPRRNISLIDKHRSRRNRVVSPTSSLAQAKIILELDKSSVSKYTKNIVRYFTYHAIAIKRIRQAINPEKVKENLKVKPESKTLCKGEQNRHNTEKNRESLLKGRRVATLDTKGKQEKHNSNVSQKQHIEAKAKEISSIRQRKVKERISKNRKRYRHFRTERYEQTTYAYRGKQTYLKDKNAKAKLFTLTANLQQVKLHGTNSADRPVKEPKTEERPDKERKLLKRLKNQRYATISTTYTDELTHNIIKSRPKYGHKSTVTENKPLMQKRVKRSLDSITNNLATSRKKIKTAHLYLTRPSKLEKTKQMKTEDTRRNSRNLEAIKGKANKKGRAAKASCKEYISKNIKRTHKKIDIYTYFKIQASNRQNHRHTPKNKPNQTM